MKKYLAVLLAAVCVLSCSCTAGGAETTEEPEMTSDTPVTTEPVEITPETEEINVDYNIVQNPVAPNGADPWVIEHEGSYYYCYSGSYGATGGVRVAKLPSMHEIPPIFDAEGSFSQVYTAPEGTAYSYEYWAPELHYLDGAWYIYVAADDGNNDNHRMYVLKGTTQDPTDPFEMVGKITDPSDKWAIDGTVAQINGEMYFIWSGWEGEENVAQNIYIAHMSDPCTVDSERTMLSAPEYAWEQSGMPHVNEGPAALYGKERIYVAYSASGSWTNDYCIGLLSLTGEDPLDSTAWEKSAVPVFRALSGTAYGPGHCSFTKAIDGSTWMIYHANPQKDTGWAGRTVWIAPIFFDASDKPSFGTPQKEVPVPVIAE